MAKHKAEAAAKAAPAADEEDEEDTAVEEVDIVNGSSFDGVALAPGATLVLHVWCTRPARVAWWGWRERV